MGKLMILWEIPSVITILIIRYLCVCMYVCCVYIVCMYVCMCVCMYVCVCLYVCMYVVCMHVHLYLYIFDLCYWHVGMASDYVASSPGLGRRLLIMTLLPRCNTSIGFSFQEQEKWVVWCKSSTYSGVWPVCCSCWSTCMVSPQPILYQLGVNAC